MAPATCWPLCFLMPGCVTGKTGAALAKACAGVRAVLLRTAADDADELRLIEAQTLFAQPQLVFQPERIS